MFNFDFSIDWGAVVTAVGAGAAVFWAAFRKSGIQGDWKTEAVLRIIQAAVAWVWNNKVRDWKSDSPDGTLSPLQKAKAMEEAKDVTKKLAAEEGLGSHPILQNDLSLTGHVQEAVRQAKAPVAAPPRRLVSKGRPSSRG